jgi:hypothetical protein
VWAVTATPTIGRSTSKMVEESLILRGQAFEQAYKKKKALFSFSSASIINLGSSVCCMGQLVGA